MVDLKNQPTLTQFIRTTNEKKEDAAKKIVKKEEREDKKEETGTMEDGQEDKEDNKASLRCTIVTQVGK